MSYSSYIVFKSVLYAQYSVRKYLTDSLSVLSEVLGSPAGHHSPTTGPDEKSFGRRAYKSQTMPAGESWYRVATQQARENEGIFVTESALTHSYYSSEQE